MLKKIIFLYTFIDNNTPLMQENHIVMLPTPAIGLPPEIKAEISPLLVAQFGEIVSNKTESEGGAFKITLSIAKHPLNSETVTMYLFKGKPIAVESFKEIFLSENSDGELFKYLVLFK